MAPDVVTSPRFVQTRWERQTIRLRHGLRVEVGRTIVLHNVRPRRAWMFVTLAVTPAVTGLLACGPSFQAVYECDVHFEHCYALDESGASVDQKKECWRDWLHGYTYGQSRDRVEYGGTRYSELSLDPTLPSEDQPSARAKHIVAAPVPTNAFAPPPMMAGAVVASDAHAPASECSDGCAQRWTSCRSTCKQSGCDACDQAYKLCVPGCFRDDGSGAGYRPATHSLK
jgi:hypothetical protein